jgi:putative ABC transport system ATP-binding protein
MTNVTKVYRGGLFETHALAGLSVHVAAGEIVAVMGPSGSGKTTFLNVAGLLEPLDGGEYLLDGEPVAGLSDGRTSALRNEKIGFVFQSFQLIGELDVYENVEVPLQYRRKMSARERKERVEQVIARVGLSARASHSAADLSGGQQQRVAIARALVGSPRVILADEPTANLDSRNARRILDLLASVNAEGTTVVIATHDPEVARRATRVVHVLEGKLVEPRAAGGAPTVGG